MPGTLRRVVLRTFANVLDEPPHSTYPLGYGFLFELLINVWRTALVSARSYVILRYVTYKVNIKQAELVGVASLVFRMSWVLIQAWTTLGSVCSHTFLLVFFHIVTEIPELG
jgi:hypothetical protein